MKPKHILFLWVAFTLLVIGFSILIVLFGVKPEIRLMALGCITLSWSMQSLNMAAWYRRKKRTEIWGNQQDTIH